MALTSVVKYDNMIWGVRACDPNEARLKEFEKFPEGARSVCRDLGHENPDAARFKALLAAEIIKALDRDSLTVRAAQSHTGIAAADFSRIRNAR